MECIICQEKMTDKYVDYESGALLERFSYCEKMHYEYEYAYGGCREVIGDITIVTYWNDTQEIIKISEQIRKQAIELIKLQESRENKKEMENNE